MKTCIVTVYSRKAETFNDVYVDGVLQSTLFSSEFDIANVAKIYSDVKMIRVSASEYINKKRVAELIK